MKKFKYQPSYLIGTTAYSAGTATFTQGSTAVLGIGTTFTSDMWGGLIKPTGDTAYYTVASVTDATHLTLTSAYTPVTNTSTYAILADRLQDLDNFTYLGTITWGSNPAGVACTVSPLVSASNPGVLAGITTPQPDMATIVSNQGDLTGNDNAEVSTNLLTPLWQPWSDLTNIPVLVFLLIIGTTFLIVAVVYVMKKTQNQLIGSIVLIIGEAFLYKMGIYELWFVIITGLICLALIIMERKPAF